MGFLLLLNPDRNLRVVRGLVFLLLTSCSKLTVYKSTVYTGRGHRPIVVPVPTKLSTMGEAEIDHLRVPAEE